MGSWSAPHRFSVCLLAAFSLAATQRCSAAPARFWVSIDGISPGTPGVPEVVTAVGIPRRFHIWAQPRTRFAGDYHAATNPFMTFENVSLNVVSPQSTFTIDSAEIDVANPTYSSLLPRYELVGDSSSGLMETTGAAPGTYDDLPFGFARGVLDLQGFTLNPGTGEGFGVDCDPSDTACGTTTSGAPAWLFASFTLTPTSSSGTVEFQLQVGRNGMTDAGTTSTSFDVEFGVDTIGAAPLPYDPDFDRSVTLPDDDPDLVLNLAGPGDYNADGSVDTADYDVWRSQFGTSQYDADGNGDGIVDAADYSLWRDHAVLPASVGTTTVGAVPEPDTMSTLGLLAAVTIMIVRRDIARSTRSSSGE